MTPIRTKERIGSLLRASVAILLIASLFIPSVHHWEELLCHHHDGAEHVHHHENRCSEEAENDPCHRKLVHHDETADCSHDAHISTSHVECLICSLVPIRHEGILVEQRVFTLDFIKETSLFGAAEGPYLNAYIKSNESRGPPSITII